MQARSKRKPSGFEERLNASIALLQKAEPLALRYNDNGYYLAFSGGKDSQALYHVAEMAGVQFEAVMSATSVDPPEVLRFVRSQYPKVRVSPPPHSIFQRAVERGILPSMRVRWCCADFKEGAGAGRVTLTGVRRKESARRAKRNEMEVSGRKFSGSADEFERWQSEQIERIRQRMLKKEGKHLGEDYFSLDKDQEIRCVGGKDTIIVNPLLQWSEDDVWYFLNEVAKVPHCSLYDRGYRRIGCILCPMSSYKHKLREMKDYPHVKRGWIRAIKEIRRGGGIQKHQYMQVPSGYGKWGGWIPAPSGHWMPDIEEVRSQIHQGQLEPTVASQAAHRNVGGFSTSLSADGTAEGQDQEPTEDQIAERIFDWWISGKSYDRWYAETYLQMKIDFKEE